MKKSLLVFIVVVLCISCAMMIKAQPMMNLNSASSTSEDTPLFIFTQTKNMSMIPGISHFPMKGEIRDDCLLDITLYLSIENGERDHTWGLFALTDEQYSQYLIESNNDTMYMPYTNSFYQLHVSQRLFSGSIQAMVEEHDIRFRKDFYNETLTFLLKEVVGEDDINSRSSSNNEVVDYANVKWKIKVVGRSIPKVEKDDSALIGGIVGGVGGLLVLLGLTVIVIVGVKSYLKKNKDKSFESTPFV